MAIVRIASMAYQHRTTTNNLAEYYGLLHGPRGAQDHGFTPLSVVGDSQMTIRQN